MNAAPALIPTLNSTLTVVSGPDRGTVYRIVSSKVTLGRGSDNDIVVQDPKCSRHHAILVWTDNGFEIRDVSDKNSIRVNGEDCQNAVLSDGAQIELGSTELRFASHPLQAGPTTLLNEAIQAIPPQPLKKSPRPRRSSTSGSPMLIIIVGLILGALWLGLSQPKGAKKAMVTLRTDEQVAEAIREAEDLKNKKLADKQKGSFGLSKQQAQESYVAGFRDYKKGQFERAMQAFQACLALDPTHELCHRYHRVTQRKFNELIQYHMVLGRTYRDQNQYSACRSSFRNVMTMVKDPNNSTYKEAKANFETCDTMLEDRF